MERKMGVTVTTRYYDWERWSSSVRTIRAPMSYHGDANCSEVIWRQSAMIVHDEFLKFLRRLISPRLHFRILPWISEKSHFIRSIIGHDYIFGCLQQCFKDLESVQLLLFRIFYLFERVEKAVKYLSQLWSDSRALLGVIGKIADPCRTSGDLSWEANVVLL